MRDEVLDPILEALPPCSLTIDTLPRRYHLPDSDPARWPARVPDSLPELIKTMLETFGIDRGCAAALDRLIRRGRSEYAGEVAGYRRLFAAARPKAILLVRNGLEKALFHVAREHGIPTIEVQHGLIGYGHPAYSYPSDVNYARQTTLPFVFLTFSDFWNQAGHYPAGQRKVLGADHFAANIAPVVNPLGAIMVIVANIYHAELLEVTREIANRLPHRKIIYKLHPNQKHDSEGIRNTLSSYPNVSVGDPLISASKSMNEVSHVIAIQSTVVYEALQNGRRVCILPRYDYEIHSDVFDLHSVSVPETLDKLISDLEISGDLSEHPMFFEKFDGQRARDLLIPILQPDDEQRYS